MSEQFHDDDIEFDFFEEVDTREQAPPERSRDEGPPGPPARPPRRPQGSGISPRARLIALIAGAVALALLLVATIPALLASLQTCASAGAVVRQTIVVDDDSTDGTAALLASLGGDVQVIRNTENLGFATACNQGARAARGRHVVFLNNDTVPLPGWLTPLIAELDADPTVAVVGSKLLYPDDTIQHAGVGLAFDFDFINLLAAVARMHEAEGEVAIVGEKQKSS